VCGVGVWTTTLWAFPSPEETVTETARNAGAETVAGLTAPPDWITNDAGTRALLDPPAGFGAIVPRELPPEEEVGGWALTPPDPDGLDGFGFFAGVLVVCDGVLGVLVVVVVLGVLGVLVDAGAGALAVVELLEWLDPPHAASASEAINAPENWVKTLTFSAYEPNTCGEDEVHKMQFAQTSLRQRLVEYDGLRRRVWILGQRCHHGATGSVVAALACVGLIVDSMPPISGTAPRSMLAVTLATGGVLMVHDWKDRSIWFERGRGSQA
jgi:hypothetical protein